MNQRQTVSRYYSKMRSLCGIIISTVRQPRVGVLNGPTLQLVWSGRVFVTMAPTFKALARSLRKQLGRKGPVHSAHGNFELDWRTDRFTASGDEVLQDLCQRFLKDFASWINMFPAEARCKSDISPEMDRLEESWCSALRCIEGLTPTTLVGAMAMLEVALAYARWAAPGEGRAAKLLMSAGAPLQEILSREIIVPLCQCADGGTDRRI